MTIPSFTPGFTPGFTEEVAASFPPGLSLPDEFRRLLDWMEANGFVRTWRLRPGRYASLYPASMGDEGTSLVAFEPVGPDHMRHWTGIADRAVTDRLAPFIRTGGDGSYAGLWRDEDGAPRFVHFGSGSGSVMAGVLVESAVDMLRFLAIGYVEPAFPECHGITPEEEVNEYVPRFVPPTAFREWVTTAFGVTIPARATEVVRAPASIGDVSSGDPFLVWLAEMQDRFG